MNSGLNRYISINNRGRLAYIMDTLSDDNKQALEKIIVDACKTSESFGFCDGLASKQDMNEAFKNDNSWMDDF